MTGGRPSWNLRKMIRKWKMGITSEERLKTSDGPKICLDKETDMLLVGRGDKNHKTVGGKTVSLGGRWHHPAGPWFVRGGTLWTIGRW